MGTADPDRNAEAITLYRLHGCPYCERVVRWLEENDLAYRSHFVPGEHSRRDAVKRVAGTRSVPVIEDPRTGITMAESDRIIGYLERTYGADDSRADRPAEAEEGA